MSQENSKQQKSDTRTEAQERSADGRAGESRQSSENAKSHDKAGKDSGAGGGKKQERHH